MDYDTPMAAEYAMSSTIGYRLSNSNKGISKYKYKKKIIDFKCVPPLLIAVRFSENSKNN